MSDKRRTTRLALSQRATNRSRPHSPVAAAALFGFVRLLTTTLIYLALGVAAVLFLLPLLWMVITAFKEARLLYANPPVWAPWPPTLQNFRAALGLVDFAPFFRNSIFVAALSVTGVICSSSLAGFAFALLPARGRNVLFALLLATLAVPATITIIPSFLLFSLLGWVGSYLPLIVPRWFAEAFYVFLFRQFFRSIPRELFDSAALDGCSSWGLYWRIALPLARPAIVTAAVFSFLTSWNDYLGPLLYLNSPALYTVPLGLAFFQNQYYTQLQYLMPIALIALLPVLLVFLVAQHFIVEGIKTAPADRPQTDAATPPPRLG
jgi:multiple sugar transport system permease protein